MMLAHDDNNLDGPLVVLLPGAGDLRSEFRFTEPALTAAGYRVVTADLPGHGESDVADSYGVAETAAALISLVRSKDAGPAVVIGCSFSPAAAVWAAAEAPDTVRAVVSISPHFEAATTFAARAQTAVADLLLRSPWASKVWSKLYRGWYKSQVPVDIDPYMVDMDAMWNDPARRRAGRITLTAHRHGMDERMAGVADLPALTIFGGADDHFPNPKDEGEKVVEQLGGQLVMVDGAGHYPHAERPDVVNPAIVEFLSTLA